MWYYVNRVHVVCVCSYWCPYANDHTMDDVFWNLECRGYNFGYMDIKLCCYFIVCRRLFFGTLLAHMYHDVNCIGYYCTNILFWIALRSNTYHVHCHVILIFLHIYLQFGNLGKSYMWHYVYTMRCISEMTACRCTYDA